MDKEVPVVDENAVKMVTKKKATEKKVIEKKVIEKKFDATFSLEQLLTAKRYRDKKDVLNVVLNKDLEYNLKEVDRLIEEFMEGVK